MSNARQGIADTGYKRALSAVVNRKGVLDVDTFKGCPSGVSANGPSGCYGACYAARIANLYKRDFARGVERSSKKEPFQIRLFDTAGDGWPSVVYRIVEQHELPWFRIGTMGDPSHAWDATVEACEWLGVLRTPVVVTKHWFAASDSHIRRLRTAGVVLNTSVSALDSDQELGYRLKQHHRFVSSGVRAVLRVVTCDFCKASMRDRQGALLSHKDRIDNPLRVTDRHSLVTGGIIRVEKHRDLQAVVSMSLHDKSVYVGHCKDCPDQCGVKTK
jgi:hypothetical protein